MGAAGARESRLGRRRVPNIFNIDCKIPPCRLRLGVTYEKGVTLGNVTMSHRTRESPPPCRLHSTMIGLSRAQH
ncbi:hypothetical protein EVAR_12838_1 [Eumeta japonica]|uniref:Uncharacterized protein n=1 Tax=Eumeta variegata TaxID=151549 RepID=A0A4C1UAV7_EUMVA|nr:hypothetical protein EVAR_12838_1 [Eumeta japonica]